MVEGKGMRWLLVLLTACAAQATCPPAYVCPGATTVIEDAGIPFGYSDGGGLGGPWTLCACDYRIFWYSEAPEPADVCATARRVWVRGNPCTDAGP